MCAFQTSLLPHSAYSVKHPQKPKNVHVEALHRNLGIARSLDALNYNFLVIEQLPADVPRHDMLLVSIEVAGLPANVELVLRVGTNLFQLRLPISLAGHPSLGLPHAKMELTKTNGC